MTFRRSSGLRSGTSSRDWVEIVNIESETDLSLCRRSSGDQNWGSKLAHHQKKKNPEKS